jgi:hypothetical protein
MLILATGGAKTFTVWTTDDEEVPAALVTVTATVIEPRLAPGVRVGTSATEFVPAPEDIEYEVPLVCVNAQLNVPPCAGTLAVNDTPAVTLAGALNVALGGGTMVMLVLLVLVPPGPPAGFVTVQVKVTAEPVPAVKLTDWLEALDVSVPPLMVQEYESLLCTGTLADPACPAVT